MPPSRLIGDLELIILFFRMVHTQAHQRCHIISFNCSRLAAFVVTGAHALNNFVLCFVFELSYRVSRRRPQ
jgi:hypothetical protein